MSDQTDPMETELLQQFRLEHTLFWHRLRCEAVERRLPGGRDFVLLDVGAGVGHLGEHLCRRRPDIRYRFVEPIRSVASRLERRFGAEANVTEAPDHASARCVCLLDVLEHIEDDRGFLADLAGRMAPGARLILTVPALRALWSPHDEALGHRRRYRRGTLRSTLRDLPGEIRELSYLFPELLLPGLLRRFRKRLAAARGEVETGGVPELPRPVNAAFYWLGRATLPLARLHPVGTSLIAVWDRA